MKTLKSLIGIGLIFLLMSSCEDNSNGTCHLNLQMTDAPGNYTAVNIDLKEIEITGNDETVMIDAKPGIYNLIDLANGKQVLIASADIDAGTLEQVRLVLGDNNTVVKDGVTYPLSTPSAQQSGLKLQVHKDLVAGVTYRLLLDFDASESIVDHGNGTYSLKPVIRVIETATSGSIKGIVAPATGMVKVTCTGNGKTFNTKTSATGEFLFAGIPEGTYSVIFYPAAPLVSVTVNDVHVTIGAVTDIGTVNLSGS